MIYVELVDGENNRHWHDIMSDEYTTPTLIESARALMSCEINPHEVEDDWKLVFYQIAPQPHFTAPPYGPAVVDEPELVRADRVQVGDILDLEGDQYADPNGDGTTDTGHYEAFEFETAMVNEVTREGPTCVVLHTSQGDYGFPVDHMLKRMGHDNRAEA